MAIVAAVVAAGWSAVGYVGASSNQRRVGAAVLGVLSVGFGSWLFGQGDEQFAAMLFGSLGVVACFAGLQRGRARARGRARGSAGQAAVRRAGVWTLLVAAFLVFGFATSEGEPVCEGPFILSGVGNSFPPTCEPPSQMVPPVTTVWVVGLAFVVAVALVRK